MDRKWIVFGLRAAGAILVATLFLSADAEANSKNTKRRPATSSSKTHSKLFARQAKSSVKPAAKPLKKPSAKPAAKPSFEEHLVDFQEDYVPPVDFCDCGDDFCNGGCDIGCGTNVGCGRRGGRAHCYFGFEATVVQPRYEQNVAFTTTDSDGDNGTFETSSDTEFDYDTEFAPRLWLGVDFCDGLGWRVTWWEFDHEPGIASGNPPESGSGKISHPDFGNVDISSVVPSDTFYAASKLEAYTIDLEAIKRTSFCSWDLAIGGGLRYASSEQGYFAQLRDVEETLRGQIAYRHSIEGIGPTFSIGAYRSVCAGAGFFCSARGSVLFGDGESQLIGGEDLDFDTPFSTTRTTGRNDLLSIADLQAGFRWRGQGCRRYRPFVSLALEGQIWNGAGNASSEEGTLGFFGVASGFGIDW